MNLTLTRAATGIGLSLDRVSKHFGPVKAVDEISLEIPEASFVTLLGPSGCG